MFDENGSPAVRLVCLQSRQLFVIFTGNAERLMMPPLRFLQVTGIVAKNILLFRDPYKAGYQKGISTENPNLDGIVEYIRGEAAQSFAHVTEMFFVGTSSGGLPAIYCGHQLNARAVWCFGGRVSKVSSVQDRDAEIRTFVRQVLNRDLPSVVGDKTFTDDEVRLIRRELERPETLKRLWHVTEDPANILDHEMLRRVVELKRSCEGRTLLHLYYSPKNAADLLVAEVFDGLAGVCLHPVDGSPDDTGISLTGSVTHVVAKLLDDQGRLGDVFREYI